MWRIPQDPSVLPSFAQVSREDSRESCLEFAHELYCDETSMETRSRACDTVIKLSICVENRQISKSHKKQAWIIEFSFLQVSIFMSLHLREKIPLSFLHSLRSVTASHGRFDVWKGTRQNVNKEVEFGSIHLTFVVTITNSDIQCKNNRWKVNKNFSECIVPLSSLGRCAAVGTGSDDAARSQIPVSSEIANRSPERDKRPARTREKCTVDWKLWRVFSLFHFSTLSLSLQRFLPSAFSFSLFFTVLSGELYPKMGMEKEGDIRGEVPARGSRVINNPGGLECTYRWCYCYCVVGFYFLRQRRRRLCSRGEVLGTDRVLEKNKFWLSL